MVDRISFELSYLSWYTKEKSGRFFYARKKATKIRETPYQKR